MLPRLTEPMYPIESKLDSVDTNAATAVTTRKTTVCGQPAPITVQHLIHTQRHVTRSLLGWPLHPTVDSTTKTTCHIYTRFAHLSAPRAVHWRCPRRPSLKAVVLGILLFPTLWYGRDPGTDVWPRCRSQARCVLPLDLRTARKKRRLSGRRHRQPRVLPSSPRSRRRRR